MDGSETTISVSVNGGPAVPLNDVAAAEREMAKLFPAALAKPKTETRSLMCRLTDDEQRVRGVDLADQQKLLADLTEQKRAIGDQIKDAQAKIGRLAETVKHRQEERPVTCLMTPDYSADSMTITRTDNGEIVAVRQLHHAERQPELPLDAKK